MAIEEVIAIDLQYFRNFVSMDDARRKCNSIKDLSKIHIK